MIIYILLNIMTLGIIGLCSRWYIKLYLCLQFRSCKRQFAQYVLITGIDHNKELIPLIKAMLSIDMDNSIEDAYMMFSFRYYKYYYDESMEAFIQLRFQLKDSEYNEMNSDSYNNNTCSYQSIFTKYIRGVISQDIYDRKYRTYGKNSTEIMIKSDFKIIIDEILTPFYVFQIFSIILWIIEEYYEFSFVILILSLISVISGLIEIKKNLLRIKQISLNETDILVFRNYNQTSFNDNNIMGSNNSTNKGISNINSSIDNSRSGIGNSSSIFNPKYRKLIKSSEIVPGDLIEISGRAALPCDLLLLQGTCIMNEATLTGESTPVIKTSLPNNHKEDGQFSLKDSKGHILYCGTICLEARTSMDTQYVVGLAINTGFDTMKGQLIRSMMFPKSNKFKFYIDSMKFIGVMGLISILGFLSTIQTLINFGLSNTQIILKSLDLITIIVPPSLPTCMSIGLAFAIKKLQKKQIYCTSPPTINVAGKLDVMCFDKTGTLTEEGLEIYGVLPVYKEKSSIKFDKIIHKIDEYATQHQLSSQHSFEGLEEVLATCHSLTFVDNVLVGDPLDLKMFASTKWSLEESKELSKKGILASITSKTTSANQRKQMHVLKRFDFDPKFQRMSVIVCKNNDKTTLDIYLKGAPEKVRELCDPKTIPVHFHQVLSMYTQNGLRVLACAIRSMPRTNDDALVDLVHCNRASVEKEMRFVGFLIMENKLKEITPKIIGHLRDANIRTIMLTGDNLLTALSVARQCKLIPGEVRIFIGEIDEKNKVLRWKNFEYISDELDATTLEKKESNIGSYAIDELNDMNNIDEDIEKVNIERKLSEKVKSTKEGIDISLNHREIEAIGPIDDDSSGKNSLENEGKNFFDNAEIEDYEPPWYKLNSDYILAMTGECLSFLIDKINSDEDNRTKAIFDLMLAKSQVFARMNPEQKALLVQKMKEKGSIIGMCGDGANDCHALKTADVGISLSETEASLAASFTSKIQNISCVIKLLREGRSSLVTSFQCFKFIILYSLIQGTTVTLLFQCNSILSNMQFLFIDLFIILPLSISMNWTKSSKKLSKSLPSAALISHQVLISVIGHFLIQLGFQIVMLNLIWIQDWYTESKGVVNKDTEEGESRSYENTVIFAFANFHYLWICLVFSSGRPFKKSFYTNLYFTFTFIALYAFTALMLLSPTPFFKEFFSMIDIPEEFKTLCFIITMIYGLFAFFHEKIIVKVLKACLLKSKRK